MDKIIRSRVSSHEKVRFIVPTFGEVKNCNLHYYSYACEKGYGQVMYLYVVDESGKVHSDW